MPLHRLQQIAGHTDPRITQRYLHPDIVALQKDGDMLSAHLKNAETVPQWSPAPTGPITKNPLRPRSEGIFLGRADRF
ncbi:site-specific integrase [Nocardia asteroides]|nr:site-specific integrase [Nocardia asteroides]UGT58768.1 site-specific integrase [Nocardia asteroides]